MDNRPSKFEYEDLLRCGRGELFPEGPQLPLPPMLMFDRISEISETGGPNGKGFIRAELELKPDLWFFPCHFKGDPVMPGCLGLDALWQMLGFFLGWLGSPGRGRALGMGEVKFSGQVLPTMKTSNLRHRPEAGDALQAGARHRRRLARGGRLGDLSRPRSQGRPLQGRRGCAAGLLVRQVAGLLQPGQMWPNRTILLELVGFLICLRGSHETSRRHRDGYRLIDRQQHPGGAGRSARSQVGHRARG